MQALGIEQNNLVSGFTKGGFTIIKFISKKDGGSESRVLVAVEKWTYTVCFEISSDSWSKENITRVLKEGETEIGDTFYE